MNIQQFQRQGRNAGFSLIEVLVAIVVLAIGVLGVAALQSKSMSQGQGSLQATQAIALAYDYADRIRANSCGAYQGLYEISSSAYPTTAPAKDCSSSAGLCSNAQDLANWDRYDWYKNQVLQKLPNGAAVKVQCSDGSQCSTSRYGTLCGNVPSPAQAINIIIWWNEKGANNDAAITTPTYNCGLNGGGYLPTDLPCVTLSVQP